MKKPKKSGCRCSKRKHGQPKLSVGICHGFMVRKAVTERIKNKRLERAWSREVDPDDSDL